jgi:hypothetical protein
MDTLVEELQQQLTRLPLQQRARSYNLHFPPSPPPSSLPPPAPTPPPPQVRQGRHESHVSLGGEGMLLYFFRAADSSRA